MRSGVIGRAVLTAVLIAASIVCSSNAANGSPCTGITSIRETIADHDAAFIGVALEISSAAPRRIGGSGYATTKFRVERVLKGDLDSEVSVRSAGGIKGQRLGLVIDRHDGVWDGTCGAVDVARLAEVTTDAPAAKTTTPRFVLGGLFGQPQSLVLNSKGEVIREGDGGGDALVLDVCPGRRHVVELVSRDSSAMKRLHRPVIAVRSLETFDVVRRVDLTRFPRVVGQMSTATTVSCRDPEADEVLLLARGGEVHVRLLRLRNSMLTEVKTLDAHDGTLASDGSVFFATGDGGRVLKRYDIESGKETEIARIERDDVTVKMLTVNDGASLLAGLFSRQGRYQDTVFVADAASGRIVTAKAQLVGGLQWISGDRLVEAPGGFVEADLRSGHRTDQHVRVYDRSLKVLSTWRGWSGDNAVVIGETIYGLGSIRHSAPGREGRIPGSTYAPALVSAPLTAGPQRVIRELDGLDATDLDVVVGAKPIRGRGIGPLAIAIVAALAIAVLGAVRFLRIRGGVELWEA